MSVAVAVLAVVALLAAILAAYAWRSSIRLEREVAAVAERFTGRNGAGRSSTEEPIVSVLERAAQVARVQVEDSGRDRGRLVAALRRHPDGVVVVDESGTVVLRNEAAERYETARHSAAIAERAISDLLDIALQGQGSERELPFFGPPKSFLYLRASPLWVDGELLGAVVFVRDVTEARRVEAIRREFVANVSHELKTPIGALALLAETMAVGSDPLIMAQLADRLVHEADRVTRMVDDLLDLSLIEAQEAPTREPVPVYALLSEAHELVLPAARAAGVPVQIASLAADLLVRCDQRQLVSALRNLLDNAVKYSEPGEVVELSATLSGDRVCISVRDHGVGIPARDLERIFERFYRVDKARSRDTGGTGLGLSIVRHVAQAHGGEVTVDSVEGEGSVFRLSLPGAAADGRSLSEAS